MFLYYYMIGCRRLEKSSLLRNTEIGMRSKTDEESEGSQNSILQAGKDSSCMTTVLLLARTITLSSCCFSWVCWYHSRVTSVSWVGIKVTFGGEGSGKRLGVTT